MNPIPPSPSRTASGSAANPYPAQRRSSTSATPFEPRIIRANALEESLARLRPQRTSISATGTPAAPGTSTSPVSSRRTASISIPASAGTARGAGTPNRPLAIPRRSSNVLPASPYSQSQGHGHSLVHTSPPAPVSFPVPSYLSHSALRHLLQTEQPPSLPPSRYQSSSAQPYDGASVSDGHSVPGGSNASQRRSVAGSAPSVPSQASLARQRRTASPSSDSDDYTPGLHPPPHSTSPPSLVLNQSPVLHLPTRWSEQSRHPSLTVSEDGRELNFHGPSTADKEAAAARTNYDIPTACGVYYYEVEITSKSGKGQISIGFSGGDVRLTRPLGWEPFSWGYHGDDGSAFAANQTGTPYGPMYGSRDVIGCGIDFTQQRAFYTKNGSFLGHVFHNINPGPVPPSIGARSTREAVRVNHLYPSVGMRYAGESVRVNFGHERFRFDIDNYVQSRAQLVWAAVRSTPISVSPSPPARLIVHAAKIPEESIVSVPGPSDAMEAEVLRKPLASLVAGYLAHHGYTRTARALKGELAATALAISGRTDTEATADMDGDCDGEGGQRRARTRIVSCVASGAIDDALSEIEAHFPKVLNEEKSQKEDGKGKGVDDGMVAVKLKCQKFVELILEAADANRRMKAADGGNDGETGVVAGTTAPTATAGVTVRAEDGSGSGVKMDGSGAMDVDDPSPLAPASTSGSNSTLSSALSTPSASTATSRVASASASAPLDKGKRSLRTAYQSALNTAVVYGRTLRKAYNDDPRPEVGALLSRTFSVVAYEDPLAPSVDPAIAAVASPEARLVLAAEVNRRILQCQGRPTTPALERVYRQASACVIQLGLQYVGAASLADVRRELLDV